MRIDVVTEDLDPWRFSAELRCADEIVVAVDLNLIAHPAMRPMLSQHQASVSEKIKSVMKSRGRGLDPEPRRQLIHVPTPNVVLHRQVQATGVRVNLEIT